MITITPIHLLLLAFILFAFSRVILRFRDKNISFPEMLFWSLIWISAGTIIFIPKITSSLAHFFGIGRGVDFVLYVSVALNFYLTFRLYVKLDKTDTAITTMVETLAHKDSCK